MKKFNERRFRLIESGKTGVLLDRKSGEYHQLNEVAFIMTKGLIAAQTDQEIADAVCAEFDVVHNQALRDVQAFRDHLTRAKALR